MRTILTLGVFLLALTLATPDAVEPAARVSEPEGAFGFARVLIGLLVAAVVGGALWLWSRFARRGRKGGRGPNG